MTDNYYYIRQRWTRKPAINYLSCVNTLTKECAEWVESIIPHTDDSSRWNNFPVVVNHSWKWAPTRREIVRFKGNSRARCVAAAVVSRPKGASRFVEIIEVEEHSQSPSERVVERIFPEETSEMMVLAVEARDGEKT